MMEGKRAAQFHLQELLSDEAVRTGVAAEMAGGVLQRLGRESRRQFVREVHSVVAATNSLPPAHAAITQGPAAGSKLRTLRGHSNWVSALALGQGVLCSGSGDNTVRVWSLDTWQCVRTLEGHSNSVTALALGQGVLCSGSCDNTVRVWSLDTWQCIRTLEGHSD